ncbi:hypothetical protein [Litchfieldia alkalitelluris]|nr:hypothetical protein [Litchfieldia alkalitelluris]
MAEESKKKAKVADLTDEIENKELKRDFALYSEVETEKMMTEKNK